MKNSTYWFKSLCLCVCFIAGFLPAHSQQIPKSLTSSTGDLLGFLEYKPVEYDDDVDTKYPLIIFLHGIGERGNGTTQLQNVTCCGLPRIIKAGHKMRFTWNGKTETFLVLSPQCPEKYGMWPAVFITELIEYAKNNLRIDPDRIFMTGLSMGGGGTFRFISTAPENPKSLAAAATICSPCTFSNGDYVADAKLPLWSFHAADDNTALAYCTEAAITRINYANPEVKPLKTIWPTGGHIVWDRVYTDTSYKYDGVLNIYEWFLGQNRTWAPNKLPTANAGPDINITAAEAMTTLTASASTDPDGKLVRYVWKKIAGPSAGVITNAFGPNVSTTVTGLTVAGTYQYELSVVDDRASFHKDTIVVNVAPGGTPVVNKLPVAKAGNDITLTLPNNTATLNGSASSDEDGSVASYLWEKTAGPGATLSNPNAVSLSLSQLVVGIYTFKLTVTDNKGAKANDQVTITVNRAPAEAPVNIVPSAKAGNDISIVLPDNKTTLDGSASNDEDGSITSYAWSKLSGPAQFKIADPSAAKTELSLLTEGIYVFRLTITDDKGESHQDIVEVQVKAAPPPPNKAPIARAGNDLAITLPVNTVELDASASTDEDGSIVYYEWSKVSGPTLSIINSNASQASLKNLLEGAYSIKLKVRDDKGLESEDLLTIVVNPAPTPSNKTPVARAGNDIHLTLPDNKTIIDGSASSDADGTIKTYLWTKQSGPAQYKLDNPNAARTDLSQLVEGLYMFRLKVTDDKGATHIDVLDIYVKAPATPVNTPPVAKAGNDIFITLPVNKVTLNGNGSSDEDGSINSYAWSKISGPAVFHITNPNAANTQVLNLTEGEYLFALRVTDDKGGTDIDTLKVRVNPAPIAVNLTPVAQAGSNKNITLPVNSVSLNGSSSDQDGTVVKYTWSYVSGPSTWSIDNANTAIATAKGLVEGSYSFRLLVEDNMGATDDDTMVITVNKASVPPPPANKAPMAAAGADITIGLPTDHIILDGSASADADGTIISYLWSRLSGPTQYTIVKADAASTEIQNLIEGEYQFKLEVKDNEGAVNADTIKLIVLPAPNMAPLADAGKDFQVSLPDPMIQLNGLASNDPDGEIATYKWTRISGPGAITIINSNTPTPKVIGVLQGEYVFEILVVDEKGASSTDRVKVTVISGVNTHPLAAAGPDQTILSPSTYALLNGGDSYDADGRLVSYTWKQLSGPSVALMFTPNEVITEVENLEIGEYIFELTVIDNNGSSSVDKISIVISSPASNLRYEETVKIYPNPSRSTVNLQFNSDSTGQARIIIYSVNGVAVQSMIAEKPRFDFNKNLNVHHLKAGLYYVEIIVADKQKIITKFIKQ